MSDFTPSGPPEDHPLPEASPSGRGSSPVSGLLQLCRNISPIPFAVLALALIFFLYQIVGGVVTLLLFHSNITPDNVYLVRWATLVGQLLFLLLPTLLLAKVRAPRSEGFFRIRLPDVRQLLLVILGVFSLQQVLQGYMVLQEAIPLPERLEETVRQFKTLLEDMYRVLVTAKSPQELLMVLLVVALTPAVCEELLFRGLIQRSFEGAVGGIRGAVITGLIFAAYHVNPFAFIPLAALVVYFGFVVYRSQNITLAMAAHFLNNFLACLAVYLELQDDFVAVQPMGSPSSLMVLLNSFLFGVVFLITTSYFIRITKPVPDTVG